MFMLRRGELRERFDPYYHKQFFKNLRTMFSEKGFQPIGTIIQNWDRGDGPRDGFYTEDTANGVFFLRINNLKEHSIDVSNVKLINREIHENTLRRSQVCSGDVIFAISGTKDNLGTVSIVPDFIKEANLNSALVRLDLDTDKVNKEYFCWLFDLDFVRTQIDFIGKGAAQNNLNNKEISQIRIPLFDMRIQESIVENLKQAHTAKRAKEVEARALLESIDKYVLSELGITLPEEHREMMFRVPFSRVRGGRFDPSYYQSMITLHSNRFPSVRLNTVAEINPKVSFAYLPADTLLSFIPMEAVDERFAEITVMQTRPAGSFKGYTRFEEQDLLWAKITPCMENGKSAIAQNLSNGAGFGSTEFHVVRAGENVNIHYIHSLLRLRKVRETATLDFTGSSGHQRVSAKFLQQFIIPLPPLDVQERIAREAQARRERAKALECEAAELLQAAKAEVERMILGSPNSL